MQVPACLLLQPHSQPLVALPGASCCSCTSSLTTKVPCDYTIARASRVQATCATFTTSTQAGSLTPIAPSMTLCCTCCPLWAVRWRFRGRERVAAWAGRLPHAGLAPLSCCSSHGLDRWRGGCLQQPRPSGMHSSALRHACLGTEGTCRFEGAGFRGNRHKPITLPYNS